LAALVACQLHYLHKVYSHAAAKTLVDSYPNDLDDSFGQELRHFAMFADICTDDEPGNITTELFL